MKLDQARMTRGETFIAPLAIKSGDASGAVCRMAMKRAVNGGPPPPDSPVVAELDVIYIASPAQFVGTLSATASADLEPAVYVMDARIESGGTVTYTDPARIVVMERVTPDA